MDNEGIVTATGWVDELLASDTVKKVILIRINHGSEPATDGKPDFTNGPLFNELFGPEYAMLQVRTTSQQERGELESSLLSKQQQASGKLTVVNLTFGLPALLPKEEVEWLKPPLSWKLSAKQKTAYDIAWKELVSNGAANDLKKLRGLLTPR